MSNLVDEISKMTLTVIAYLVMAVITTTHTTIGVI
jgi:hypothetical protein